MAIKISMPKLSDTMTEGHLVKWRKKEGDRVESAEIIAEAESDKATMELEAYDSGVLLKILVPEGGKVAVGGTLAIIGEKGEDISALLQAQSEKIEPPPAESKRRPTSPAATPPAPPPDPSAPASFISDAERIKASPLARKMAADFGLNLHRISGSGTGGRIIQRDIENAQRSSAVQTTFTSMASREDRVITLNTMRTTIAKRLTQSKNTAPHFYLTAEINMDQAVEFRAKLNSLQAEIKISYNDLIVMAAAKALTKHPNVNGSFQEDRILQHGRVDIGVAVALEDGLITPVVRDADRKGIIAIAQEIRTLADKARQRKLLPEEYSGSTFTVSNLGMYEVTNFTAIINPPEAAILAVGSVLQKPVVRDNQIVPGWCMEVTLSCDHRIVDGASGALYLQELKRLLENPLALML